MNIEKITNATTKTAAAKGTRPPVIPFTDEQGRKCVRVPLDPQGNAYAVVLEKDYQTVRQTGATSPWYLNANSSGTDYVRTNVRDEKGRWTKFLVARIITGAGAREVIYYANKDRLDIRPENLFWGRDARAKRNAVNVVRSGAKYWAERQQDAGAAA